MIAELGQSARNMAKVPGNRLGVDAQRAYGAETDAIAKRRAMKRSLC